MKVRQINGLFLPSEIAFSALLLSRKIYKIEPVWNQEAFGHLLMTCKQDADTFKARVFACARELLRITGLDSEYGDLNENTIEAINVDDIK